MRPEPVAGPVVPVVGLAHGSRHAAGPAAIEQLMAAVDAPEHPARTLARSHGWTLVEPLGERAADIVLERYRSALR